MAIQRWDPLRDLMELQERMKQLFDDALSRSAGPGGTESMTSAGWRPPMDLFEMANAYVLRVDLPGVSASQVELQVENGTLHLRGERKLDGNVERDAYLRIERHYGPFHSQLTLPSSVDPQEIRARHDNGVIEILLPKKQGQAPSQIKIESGKRSV